MYNQCTVQLSLNFMHMCQYTSMPARLLHVKQKFGMYCTYTVACNCSVCTTASKYDLSIIQCKQSTTLKSNYTNYIAILMCSGCHLAIYTMHLGYQH